jgi:hypothetical protein
MTDVKSLLESYHFDVLREMAELLEVSPDTTRKRSHIKALVPVLFTPQAVEKGLSLLSEPEALALAEIQRAKGRIQATRLRSQLLRNAIIEPQPVSQYSRNYAVPRATDPAHRRQTFGGVVARLMGTGLVCGEDIVDNYYSNRTKIHYDNVEILYIPPEIEDLLPEPPPLAPVEINVQALNQVQEGSARAFQRDLYFYWSTAHTTPLTLTKDGRLYKRDLRLVNEALLQPIEIGDKDEPDYPRLIFLRLLLTDLGLLNRRGQTVSGADHPEFLGRDPSDRIKQTFIQWREGTFWNELFSVPGIILSEAGTRIDPVPAQIAAARGPVLEHMAELHRVGMAANPSLPLESRWVPIAQLIESLRVGDYDFLFPRNYKPTTSYYYGYSSYASFRSPYISYGNEMGWNISPRFDDESEGWDVVEVGFVRSMLTEPMRWMGLVDIGYAGDRPVAYRLTPVGEWVLGVGQEIAIPQAEGKVIVQPNFEIFALDPISDLTLAKLDEFADRANAERAMKYRLTRESVYRAQRNGWTSGRIIETLDRLSDTPLPQNVLRTLEEWQTIHERIKIYRQGSLLQAADAELLDRLVADHRVANSLIGRPDQNAALIASRPGEIRELSRHLQEMGYPAARTRTADQDLHPSLTIDSNGQILFTIPLPSIYLYEQITPFTSQDERGRYFITQSAVQEAIEKGMSVQEILTRLTKLHLGHLPRWVEIKIRAWGHYYGDVAVQTLTLIQVKDKETLRELLAEPETEDILRPFAPDEEKALAVVVCDDPKALRELLAERSIAITKELE